jgi:hypothetical protein
MSGHDIPLEELAQAHRTLNRVFMASIQGLLKTRHGDTVSMALQGRRVVELAMRDVYGDKQADMILEEEGLRLEEETRSL